MPFVIAAKLQPKIYSFRYLERKYKLIPFTVKQTKFSRLPIRRIIMGRMGRELA